MTIVQRLRVKLVLWAAQGLTDERAAIRRFLLMKVLNNVVDEYLKEGNMEDKPWYKSKAKLAAILGALVGIIQPISTAVGHPIVVPTWILEVLGAIGIYGVRDAIGKDKIN